jgi:O-succinylbenzoate synthase
MLLERVTLYHLRMELKAPFETSFERITHRDCILVEAAAEDVVGYGECVADRNPAYSYENTGTAGHIMEQYLIPALWGKQITHPAQFQNLVKWVRGHQMAKAGIEMALWDALGKKQGKSLREMLGGSRDRVEVGVSIGIKSSPQELVEVAASYLEAGYRRVKIKIKPGVDVAETQAMRSAYPDLPLQVDANSAYTLETARVLKPLDELNLLLIEQPLAEDDIWDHHYLQAALKTPICLDESIHNPRHARQAIEMDACRIINIKPGRVGGLSQAVIIHDLCQEQNVPVWCGGMLETGVGRASNLAVASLANFTLPGDISASDRYYHEDITNETFTLDPDSTIGVPDKPGLGVTIDPKVLKRATIHRETYLSE